MGKDVGDIIKGTVEAPQLLTGKQMQSRVGGGFLETLAEVGKVVQTLQGKGDQVTAFETQQAKVLQQERERQIKQSDDAAKFVADDAMDVVAKNPIQNLIQSIQGQEPATAKIAQAYLAGGNTEKALSQAQTAANRIGAEDRRQNTARGQAIDSAIKGLKEATPAEEVAREKMRNLLPRVAEGMSQAEFQIALAPELKKLKYGAKEVKALFKEAKQQAASIGKVPGPISPLTPNAAVNLKQEAQKSFLAMKSKLKIKNAVSPEDKQILDAAIEMMNSSDPEEQELAQKAIIKLNAK